MWKICLNYHQRMGILPLKKRVNRDKCSFATKQRMFGVFAIDEILRYRGTRFPSSRTLCHPGWLGLHWNRSYGVMGLLSKMLGDGWMGDTPSNIMTNEAPAVLINWYSLGRDWLKEDFYKISTQITMFEREFYYSLKLAGGHGKKTNSYQGAINSQQL